MQNNNPFITCKLGSTSFVSPGIIQSIPNKALDFSREYLSREEINIIFACSAVPGMTQNQIKLYDASVKKNKILRNQRLEYFYDTHNSLIRAFLPSTFIEPAKKNLDRVFKELKSEAIDLFHLDKEDIPGAWYASILSYGEIASTDMYSTILSSLGKPNVRLDAKRFIKTTGPLDCARINIHRSNRLSQMWIPQVVNRGNIFVGEGFFGADDMNNLTSVLPLNGSDWSASAYAHVFKSKLMLYPKDIWGIYKDSKKPIDDPVNIFEELTRKECLEMFDGKKTYPVHPESFRVLAIDNIPARICCNLDFNQYGTWVRN